MAAQTNSKTVRLMLFLLAFLSVVMLFVFLVVIPAIKTYKTKKALYRERLLTERKLSEKEQQLQKELETYKKEYSDTLEVFRHPFDETAFLEVARQYFQNVKLTPKEKKKSESGLQVYTFEADFNAQTPVKFYQFVDALQKMDSVVKINFPIEIESEGKIIRMQFNLSVYRLEN
jgi:hypothetical protein